MLHQAPHSLNYPRPSVPAVIQGGYQSVSSSGTFPFPRTFPQTLMQTNAQAPSELTAILCSLVRLPSLGAQAAECNFPLRNSRSHTDHCCLAGLVWVTAWGGRIGWAPWITQSFSKFCNSLHSRYNTSCVNIPKNYVWIVDCILWIAKWLSHRFPLNGAVTALMQIYLALTHLVE